MFKRIHIHFIGIGGIGMSGIAQVLYKKGFKISGSDLSEDLIVKKLKKKMKISSSHKAENINNADIVVYSSAIKKNNIELVSAKKLKIPVFSRAMMLAQVMKLKSSITVAGSHGKTTTTSLIASIFENSGMDPTILSGGNNSSEGILPSAWMYNTKDSLFIKSIFSKAGKSIDLFKSVKYGFRDDLK